MFLSPQDIESSFLAVNNKLETLSAAVEANRVLAEENRASIRVADRAKDITFAVNCVILVVYLCYIAYTNISRH